MTTIKVNLNMGGIDDAIEELNAQRKVIQAESHQLFQELCDEARDIAQSGYDLSMIANNEDSEYPIMVSSEPTEDGYKVVATGKRVAFHEFGAGLTAGSDYPLEYIPEGIDASPGAWSQSMGSGQFNLSKHPWWYYKGQRFSEIAPSFAMYNAAKHIRENVVEKARKVFK